MEEFKKLDPAIIKSGEVDLDRLYDLGPIWASKDPSTYKDYLDILTTEHWHYIQELLLIHEFDKQVIDKIEFHYQSAFKHGFKHGIEYLEGNK